MNNMKLLSSLTFPVLLLTSCSLFNDNSIDEPTARSRLNNIKANQESESFVFPSAISVTKKVDMYVENTSFGNTEIIRENLNLLLAMDLNNLYFQYSLTNLLTPALSESEYFYVQDGVFYMVRESMDEKIYNTMNDLTGQEVIDILLLQAAKRDLYGHALGEGELLQSYRMLDYYQNGIDAYRDSLQIGSKVKQFEYDFYSDDVNEVELKETLESTLDYSSGLNYGVNDNYSYRDYVFQTDILKSATVNIITNLEYYFQDTLISLYNTKENVEINTYLSVDLEKVDLTNFVYNETLTF